MLRRPHAADGPDPVGPDGVQLCDQAGAPNQSPDWQGAGWYQIGEGNTEVIALGPTDDYACGGTAGGWYNGVYPSPSGGVVVEQMCFAFDGDICAWSVEIEAVNCSGSLLVNLPAAPDCDLRYCLDMIIPW